jgi:hypothetical protein
MLGQAKARPADVAVQEPEPMVAKEPPVGVRFPREVAALEKLAKDDDRSLSYIINRTVLEYLRARKLIK